MYKTVCVACFAALEPGTQVCPACGAPQHNHNPAGSLPEGALLGEGYRVGAFLSIDSEGAVYDAVELTSHRTYQIKEYMPVTLCSGRAADLSLQVRVGSEVPYKNNAADFADLYARLRHFNNDICLLGVHEVFYANNTVYAVTEKPEGVSLSRYLEKRGGRLGWNEALDLLDPLWLSVEKLHRAGIVHRGICCENITVSGPGVVRLGGFATQAMRSQGTELKAQLYAGYAAPEQYSASDFDGPFTDIYALCAVLYRVLTGRTVPNARERMHGDTLEDPTPYASAPLADGSVQRLPTYLADVILHGLQLSGADRFADMAAFRAALAGQRPQPPAAGGAAARPTEPPRRGLWGRMSAELKVGLCTGALLLVVFIAVLLVWYTGRDNAPDAPGDTSSASVGESSSALLTDTQPQSDTQSSDAPTQPEAPDVVGQRYADVRLAYPDVRFVVSYDYSSVYEAGVVLRQEPQAQQPMPDGTLQIVVSQGAEPVPLPALEGTTAASAAAVLDGLGIQHTEVQVINDGSYAEGVVVATDPPEGTLVQPGIDTVVLRVASAQPASSSEPPASVPPPVSVTPPASLPPESQSTSESASQSTEAPPAGEGESAAP